MIAQIADVGKFVDEPHPPHVIPNFTIFTCQSYVFIICWYFVMVIYVSIDRPIALSIYRSIDLSIDLSLYPSIALSIYQSIYRSIVCLSIYLSTYLSIYLSIDLSIYLSIYLYIYPSIHLSIHRSIDLSIYLSIYLSITYDCTLFYFIFLNWCITWHDFNHKSQEGYGDEFWACKPRGGEMLVLPNRTAAWDCRGEQKRSVGADSVSLVWLFILFDCFYVYYSLKKIDQFIITLYRL